VCWIFLTFLEPFPDFHSQWMQACFIFSVERYGSSCLSIFFSFLSGVLELTLWPLGSRSKSQFEMRKLLKLVAGTKKPADLFHRLHISGRPNTNAESDYNVLIIWPWFTCEINRALLFSCIVEIIIFFFSDRRQVLLKLCNWFESCMSWNVVSEFFLKSQTKQTFGLVGTSCVKCVFGQACCV